MISRGNSMRNLTIYFAAYIKNSFFQIRWVLLFVFLFWSACYILRTKKKKTHHTIKNIIYYVLLSVNCSFIFVMTLFGREKGDYGFEILPFESYFKAFSENNIEMMLQIIINIAMFVPIGFLLPCCCRFFKSYRYVFLATVISSLFIECVQGFAKIGFFEVDDILNNVMGAMIGLLIYALCLSYKERKKDRKVNRKG